MAVIVTTTRMISTNKIEAVRAELAVQMLQKASDSGYDILVLDSKSEEKYLNSVEKIGVCLIEQIGDGMGVARREAISAAEKEFPSSSAYIWTEPEKVTMVSHFAKGVRCVEEGKDFAFFNRKSLKSYPLEQKYSYGFVRLAAKYILKKDLDFMFGPLVMSKDMIHYFTEYKSDYGDKWDSIHIPKLRAIKAGATYSQFDIDYEHPHSQTEIETGNVELFMKRIEQAHLVSSAMRDEWFGKKIVPK